MIDYLTDLDQRLFLFLNNLGNPSWDNFWIFITHRFSSIPVYFILLILIFRKFGWKGTFLIIIFVALLITWTDQISGLFKYGIQRPRPCQILREQMRPVLVNCGRYGYFSAHAANAGAISVFIGLILKRWYPKSIYILLVWAGIVAYSRIYLGVHYPLDILSGMLFGLPSGWIFYRLFLYFQKRLNIVQSDELSSLS